MKVALFGGSFNPVHNSHIEIAKYLIKNKFVDEVWLIPCKNHSFDKSILDFKIRVEMLKLAIGDFNGIKVCEIELESEGKNYTIDTLRKLKSRYNYDFLSVIGTDILYQIKKWHNYEEILNETNFLLFQREGYELIPIDGMKIVKTYFVGEGISSTTIRDRVKNNEKIDDLVPLKVRDYIAAKGLYLK